MHRMTKISLAASLVAGGITGIGVPAHASGDVVVRPGQSIQAALDAAAPGAVITVEPGTYHESLTITKSVTLRGSGPVYLRPPASAPVNACTLDPDVAGAMPGVCVVGQLVDPRQEASPVAIPVRDVDLSGLRISGFQTSGVEIYGGLRISVRHLSADHNAGGGVFAGKVDGLSVADVRADDNGSRGLDLQENVTHFAVVHSTVLRNTGEGIFVGDSGHGVIAHNRVAANCTGIAVLDENQPGDARVDDLSITHNLVIANNRFCAGDDEGAPSESGNGVALVGAQHATVAHNVIRDNRGTLDPTTGAPAQFSLGGLALLDAGPISGGAAPKDDSVVHNVVLGNAPADVLYDGSGSGNQVGPNVCSRC
jgi:nitrous oxidase accessory protein NosD